MNRKHTFLALATGIGLLSLSSCVTCYNEQFAASMMGRSSDELVASIGLMPSSVNKTGNPEIISWEMDNSYVSSYITPSSTVKSRDHDGTRIITHHPAEYRESFSSRKSGMIFTLQNNRVVNYRSYSDDGECNNFVPRSFINMMEAQKKAQ